MNGRSQAVYRKAKIPESAQGQKPGGHQESGEEETRESSELCPQMVNVHFNMGHP